MGFFNTLKHLLGDDDDHRKADLRDQLASAWGLNDAEGPLADSSEYDRANWVRKMKRVLERLPASQPEWADVAAEARALNLEPAWVAESEKDEFLLIIRKAVSDRKLTQEEHDKIELARSILGISEEEAEAALHTITGEAEAFFQARIEEVET